jgi:hypothetical protein
VWTKPGVTQADVALEDHQCWVEAQMLHPDSEGQGLGLSLALDRAFAKNGCMAAHGYVQVPTGSK